MKHEPAIARYREVAAVRCNQSRNSRDDDDGATRGRILNLNEKSKRGAACGAVCAGQVLRHAKWNGGSWFSVNGEAGVEARSDSTSLCVKGEFNLDANSK